MGGDPYSLPWPRRLSGEPCLGGALGLCASQLTSAPTLTGALGLTWAHGFWGKEGPDGVYVAHPSCGGRRAYLPLPGPLPSSHKVTPGAQPWDAGPADRSQPPLSIHREAHTQPTQQHLGPISSWCGLGRGQLAGLGQPPAISQPRALCTDTT